MTNTFCILPEITDEFLNISKMTHYYAAHFNNLTHKLMFLKDYDAAFQVIA